MLVSVKATGTELRSVMLSRLFLRLGQEFEWLEQLIVLEIIEFSNLIDLHTSGLLVALLLFYFIKLFSYQSSFSIDAC